MNLLGEFDPLCARPPGCQGQTGIEENIWTNRTAAAAFWYGRFHGASSKMTKGASISLKNYFNRQIYTSDFPVLFMVQNVYRWNFPVLFTIKIFVFSFCLNTIVEFFLTIESAVKSGLYVFWLKLLGKNIDRPNMFCLLWHLQYKCGVV